MSRNFEEHLYPPLPPALFCHPRRLQLAQHFLISGLGLVFFFFFSCSNIVKKQHPNPSPNRFQTSTCYRKEEVKPAGVGVLGHGPSTEKHWEPQRVEPHQRHQTHGGGCQRSKLRGAGRAACRRQQRVSPTAGGLLCAKSCRDRVLESGYPLGIWRFCRNPLFTIEVCVSSIYFYSLTGLTGQD